MVDGDSSCREGDYGRLRIVQAKTVPLNLPPSTITHATFDLPFRSCISRGAFFFCHGAMIKKDVTPVPTSFFGGVFPYVFMRRCT